MLLHFWSPTPVSNGLVDLSHLKVVTDRFGKDERFTMISLCMVDDPEVGPRMIKSSGLSPTQVILRNYGVEPMAVDYNAYPTPKSFLIGPDGKLIAKDLKGDQIEKSVAEGAGPQVEPRSQRAR